jgi:hypothetical protein
MSETPKTFLGVPSSLEKSETISASNFTMFTSAKIHSSNEISISVPKLRWFSGTIGLASTSLIDVLA